MVDNLSSLDKVYAKWEERNPWKTGKANGTAGNTSGANGRLDHREYQAHMDRGRKVWKDQFGNVGPPPDRKSTRYNNQRSGGGRKNFSNSQPVVSLTSSNLAQFKVYPSVMPTAGRSRPYMGRCCSCMPNSKSEFFHDKLQECGIKDVLYIEDSDRDLISRHFKKLAFVLSRRTDHKFTDVSMAVLTSPRLVEAINTTVSEELGEEAGMKQIAKKAKELKRLSKGKLRALRAAISNKLIRVTAWILHQILGRFLDTVLVHKGQMEMLTKATKSDLPIIYLPTHRSHLDYMLITFILFNYNIQAPYVAAGDNLRIPLFGSILRGLGGFFIRRKLDRGGKKDHVYRAILHTYMQEVLRASEHMEFFIEGGRTRSGKALYPKGGLLSVVVDCYNEGVIPDALLVPINISYDKLLDGNFNREQMGEEKISETFLGTMSAIWRVIQGRYGHVRVDFAQPFSLKEYLQVAQGFQSLTSQTSSGSISPNSDQDPAAAQHSFVSTSSVENPSQTTTETPSPPVRLLKRRGSCHSLYGTEVVVEDMKNTIQSLAEHIARKQVEIQAVMASQLLAFLVLVKHRQGAPLSTVIEEFDWLKEEIVHRKHDLGFLGRTEDVIDHACDMMSDLIERRMVTNPGNSIEEVYLFPVIRLPHVFQLNYNANILSTIFALESILANAIFSLVDPNVWSCQGFGEEVVQLSQETIIKRAAHLCRMFKYEFILKAPCQSYESILEDCLEQFLTSEILLTHQEEFRYRDSREQHWSKNLAKSLSCADDSDEEEWQTSVVYKLNKDCEISMHKFWFLHTVIGPLVETYFITACNLVLLQSKDWRESDFTKHVHQCLKQRAESGIAQYCESASLDTLKNALRAFEQKKVVDLYEGKDGGKMMRLNIQYKNQDKLNEFILEFESCRA